jgi:hypothetical protein
MGPAVRSGDCRHRAVGFHHYDLHAGSDHIVRGVVTDECTGDHVGRGLRSTTTPNGVVDLRFYFAHRAVSLCEGPSSESGDVCEENCQHGDCGGEG